MSTKPEEIMPIGQRFFEDVGVGILLATVISVGSKKWKGGALKLQAGGGWFAFSRKIIRTVTQGPFHFYAPFPRRSGPGYFQIRKKQFWQRLIRPLTKMSKNGRRWYGWTFYFAIVHNTLYWLRGHDDLLSFCISGGAALTRGNLVRIGSNRLPWSRRLRVFPRHLRKIFRRALPGFLFLFTLESLMTLQSYWDPVHEYEQTPIIADPFDELWGPGSAIKEWESLFPAEEPPVPNPDKELTPEQKAEIAKQEKAEKRKKLQQQREAASRGNKKTFD